MRLRLLLINSGLLISTALLCACAEDPPIDELIAFPEESGLEPRVQQALNAARTDIERARDDPAAWRHLGAVLDAHSFAPAAESAYREALRHGGDDPWTCYQLAIVLEMMDKQPDDSLRLYALAARAFPELPQPIIHSGRVLDASGDSAGARDAYLRALELNERQPLVQRALGQVYLDLGANADALRHLERAAELCPKTDGPTFAALAQAYERTGSPEKAARAREVAARTGSTLFLPDPLRAKVSSLGVSSKICLERGIARMSSGDYRGALFDLLIAAEQRADDPWIQLRLATCHEETGSAVTAARHYSRATELHAALASEGQADAPYEAAAERYRKKYLARIR